MGNVDIRKKTNFLVVDASELQVEPFVWKGWQGRGVWPAVRAVLTRAAQSLQRPL